MMTWAANKYGGVRTIGLCHGVQGGHEQISKALDIPKEELDYTCVGINHQTWYTRLSHKGREIGKQELLDAYKKHEIYSNTEKVRIDVLKNFGFYSTESNGHLSEYLAWYRKRPEEIEKWIDTSDWINGETGGYLRVCTEGRSWFETDFPNWMKEPAKEYIPEKRSHEHGSYIIESLETGRVYRGCFNIMNDGYITNLPKECVVEIPVYVDGNGISVPHVGELPLGCAAVCSQSIWVQRLAVEAAVAGDINLLRQAMFMDPLTGAVCTTPEIIQMADEMLIAEAQWLPQYAEEIVKAKQRISSSKEKETYIPVKEGYEGAVRLHVKTVDEMRENYAEARKNASEADKANKAN